MTPETRFGTSFWLAVFVLAAACVGCFGYAGMQLQDDVRRAPDDIQQPPSKLRSPISFVRTS